MSPSSANLTLFCCLVGSSFPFLVDISGSLTVCHLKYMIKQKKPIDLKDFDADSPSLYNVSIPDEGDIAQKIVDAVKASQPLRVTMELIEIFPDGPPGRTIHIAVKLPDVARISHYSPKPREAIAKSAANRPTPSVGAITSNLRKTQTSEQLDALYNNRPLQLSGPPITIYHPAFTRFDNTLAIPLDTVDFTHEELDNALNFIQAANEYYLDETSRRNAYQECGLETALKRGVVDRTTVYYNGDREMSPGGHTNVYCPLNNCSAISCFTEVNNEIGEGTDPLAHAECCYVSLVTSNEYLPVRESSCCPAFLIGMPGPYLIVSGAVYADHLISQRLTDYVYLGPISTRFNLAQKTRQVAHILRALKEGLHELEHFYGNLKPQPRFNPSCFPPHFDSFSDGKYSFQIRYIERLASGWSEKAIFKAELRNNTSNRTSIVVVKFAISYCKEAHKLLASKGLAPALWYCQQVDAVGMWVVVMDWVEGNYVDVPIKDTNIAQSLRSAMDMLHAKDLVFGDLRAPNVLVNPQKNTVMLIDFDWCGAVGIARYPPHIMLIPDYKWHKGVKRGGEIQKVHDKHMLEVLIGEDLGEAIAY